MTAPKAHPGEAEEVTTFRLARDLGMTVAELEQRMSVREFSKWAAFYAAEAKVQERADKKAGKGAGRGRRR